MKKLYISIVIIGAFLFYGCSNTSFNISDLEPSAILVNEENINLTVKETCITSSEKNITLSLINETEHECIYGVDYNLEVELDNSWYSVPLKKMKGL